MAAAGGSGRLDEEIQTLIRGLTQPGAPDAPQPPHSATDEMSISATRSASADARISFVGSVRTRRLADDVEMPTTWAISVSVRPR